MKSYKDRFNKNLLLGLIYSNCDHMMKHDLIDKYFYEKSRSQRYKYTLSENGKTVTEEIKLNVQNSGLSAQLAYKN